MFSLGGTCHPVIFRRFIKKKPTQKGEGENKERHNTTPCSLRLPPAPGESAQSHIEGHSQSLYSQLLFFRRLFFPTSAQHHHHPFTKQLLFQTLLCLRDDTLRSLLPPQTPPCPTSTPFASKNTFSFPSSRGIVRERKREGGVPSHSPPSSPTTLLPFECNVAK